MAAAAAPSFSLTMAAPDIALLRFDLPDARVNLLSLAVLEELEAYLEQLAQRSELRGLIICSAKPGVFAAGADLRELAALLDAPREQILDFCRRGQSVLERLAQLPLVTVAALDGICLGGGAELALWCDRRVASDAVRTEIGFPEVKLGIVPGWGGTVRTPRLVGLRPAVQMITSGQPLDAQAATQCGLVSLTAPADCLLEAAVALVHRERQTEQYLEDRRRWRRGLELPAEELAALERTASAAIQQQTRGHYPAPQVALDLLVSSAQFDAETACQMEAEAMANLQGTPVQRALLNVFFLSDRAKKDTGRSTHAIPTQPVRAVGVVGAGIMGCGIAAATIQAGIPTVLADASPEALARGRERILEELASSDARPVTHKQSAADPASLLTMAESDKALADCDLVIESIVENLEVKKRVYSRLQPQLRSDTILVSNTSTIPVARLAEQLERREQFCGLHFLNPVRHRRLVEVVRGAKTSEQTIAAAVAFTRQIGKLPIVVEDGPGFLINRLLVPYMNEAMEMLGEGVPMADIDHAAKQFGMPLGPLELYDLIGIDTAFYGGRTLWEAFPERIGVSPILIAMVKSGRLGQKTRCGFYRYPDGTTAQKDPELEPLLRPHIQGTKELNQESLTLRLILPMLLEATRLLEERIVRDPRDVDFGVVYGLGFPDFRGGLLFWADTLGINRIMELLKPLEHLGPRAQPTPLLRRMAEQQCTFYAL